jgi:NADPH-dependent 2,4-dienoyl-CoA reductase/sulfur reductase-like enzyme
MDVAARIDAFVAAFNDNDLDAVMTYFADDAVYRPGDGTEHHGLAEIRRAFAPQFAGAFGRMRFDEIDRLVDPIARKASIRWICRHDLGYGAGIPAPMRLFYRLLIGGTRAGWHGLDVFHFDDAGRITGKFSYVTAKRPLLERTLGAAL